VLWQHGYTLDREFGYEKCSHRIKTIKCQTPNKTVAIMAADVKIQTLALRKNNSDYPRCLELETATIPIVKTLTAIKDVAVHIQNQIEQ
jgi:hypothetical protein